MLSSLVLAASVMFVPNSWKNDTQKQILETPHLAGRTVEVCVANDCITVDRSNEPTFRAAAGEDEDQIIIKGPDAKPLPVVRPQPVEGVQSLGNTLRDIFNSVNSVHGEIEVNFSTKVKNAEGAVEETTWSVKISAGKGLK